MGRCGFLLLPLASVCVSGGSASVAEAGAASSKSWGPTMRERAVTLGGSCRLSVAPDVELNPKFRLDLLRAIGKGLRIAGLAADIGLNITRSCGAGTASGGSPGACLRYQREDMLVGELSQQAVALHAALRLDTSPVPTTSIPWAMTRLSDLTPITGAMDLELRKIIGVLHSDVTLEYLSNTADRERSEQPQDVDGYSSKESIGLPHTIGTPRNTESGKLPLLRFAWGAPYSYPSLFNYEGELYRVDLGTMERWTGNGTADDPLTATEVLFAGDGDHGLESRRQYRFRVRGVNTNGGGAWSEWSSLVDEPRGVCLDAPLAPANFGRHPDPAVAGFIKLSWDAPANEDQAGGDFLANVTYEVYGGPREAVPLPLPDAAATEFNRTVPVGGVWSFQVRAVNSAGKRSDFTPVLQLVSGAVPSRPTVSIASSLGAGRVRLVWSAPGGNGGAPITRYELSNDTFISTSVPVPASATQHDLEGQQAGARSYSVRAVNAVGCGPAESQAVTVA